MLILNVGTENSTLIQLGRQGEHGATQIWFDLKYLIDTYGAGTATLAYQRSLDELPYIVSTELYNDILIWTVNETDTAYPGIGKAEIRWQFGDNLGKTVIYKTVVQPSITGDTQIPDPYQSWYDEMIDQVGDIVDQAVQGETVTITSTVVNGNLTFQASIQGEQ